MPEIIQTGWDIVNELPKFADEEPPAWFIGANAYIGLHVESNLAPAGSTQCGAVQDGLHCDRHRAHFGAHQASWDSGAFTLRWNRT